MQPRVFYSLPPAPPLGMEKGTKVPSPKDYPCCLGGFGP